MENQLQEFRIFYNKSLHPALLLLEKKRKRLLLLLGISVLLLFGLLYLLLNAHIPALSLFAAIPIGIYGSFIAYKVKRFKAVFKPTVVAKILGFMHLLITYRYTQFIPKDTFLHSRLFDTQASYYDGEDYFEGAVGQIPFQLCELDVRDQSPVLAGMETVFRGVFLSIHLPYSVAGRVLVVPKSKRQTLTRSIKAIARKGGTVFTTGIAEFDDSFLAYTTVKEAKILSPQFWQTILSYYQKTKRPFLLSIVGKMLYIGVPEAKDLLEPKILRPNVSFQMAREFYNDLLVLTAFINELEGAPSSRATPYSSN